MAQVEIVQVRERRALRRFIEFPHQLYREDPNWVPPLRISQRDLLDARKHPFHRHAEIQCFLALEGQEVVGRIAAILDRDQFEPDHAGFFGFFESVDSPAVSGALFEAARAWLARREARVIRGPVNPSTNYECGLLVAGFGTSPCVMMTYNPPYYPALVERAGGRKAMDLYAYYCTEEMVAGRKAERVAGRALASNGVAIRGLRVEDFECEVEAVWKLYNSAWSRNWGFAPMREDEFRHLAADLKHILVPELALIGEVQGRPVGFALAVPDINQALRHADGRLFPLGLFKILYHRRRIRRLRVMALGVVEDYRTAGVAAGFYARLFQEGIRLGFREGEFSWVLEDNILMIRSLETLGARRYKTYRIYELTP